MLLYSFLSIVAIYLICVVIAYIIVGIVAVLIFALIVSLAFLQDTMLSAGGSRPDFNDSYM